MSNQETIQNLWRMVEEADERLNTLRAAREAASEASEERKEIERRVHRCEWLILQCQELIREMERLSDAGGPG